MGYSGVKGGMAAILAAERLVRRKRDQSPWLPARHVAARFRLAVDRVMGEAGLYHTETAADAFRQAEGDLLEAAHLVRAYRSALPRLAVSEPIDPDEMTVLRRIVPASRTAEGPQLLGRTSDYTPRLLDRSGEPRDPALSRDPAPASEPAPTPEPDKSDMPDSVQRRPARFSDLLRKQDLLVTRAAGTDDEPFDVTRKAARPPAPRSAVLAAMARAETGALIGLWYRSIRGPDGDVHEVTLGELRHGRLPLRVIHPHTGNPVTVGTLRATEAEAIEDLNGPAEDRTRLDIGYGLCLGHNERKAIAMANLDIACRRGGAELEQVLLLTTDGLDSGGFLEHLKLPHYVTFRSIVERKLAGRGLPDDDARDDEDEEEEEEETAGDRRQ